MIVMVQQGHGGGNGGRRNDVVIRCLNVSRYRIRRRGGGNARGGIEKIGCIPPFSNRQGQSEQYHWWNRTRQ